MVLPTPPFIPDIRLEKRALRLLGEYERERGATVTLPIPVEKIVERTLGLGLVWLPIAEQPGEIILARIDPQYLGQPTIQMNEYRRDHFEAYFGTEAFSLAHEAAHWVLHYDRGQSEQLAIPGLTSATAGAPILCRRLSDGDRREFQAERFAAFLLMPEQLLREAIRGLDLTSWSVIAALARNCGVSKRALTRRLVEIGEIMVGADNRLARARQSPHGPLAV